MNLFCTVKVILLCVVSLFIYFNTQDSMCCDLPLRVISHYTGWSKLPCFWWNGTSKNRNLICGNHHQSFHFLTWYFENWYAYHSYFMRIIQLPKTMQPAGYPFWTHKIWIDIGNNQLTPHRGNKIYHLTSKLLHLINKPSNNNKTFHFHT